MRGRPVSTIVLVFACLACSGSGSSGSGDEESAATAPTVTIDSSVYAETPAFFGYITATTLSVREDPGTTGAVVGYVFKGDRVDIYESRDVDGVTWHRLVDEAGYVEGWSSGRFVSGDPPTPRPQRPTSYGARRTPTLALESGAQYVGVDACQACHSRPGTSGHAMGEYGVWADHYHSEAFETLTRPYAQALARQTRGINDPASDWRCLKCHVTALGAPATQIGARYSQQDGVTCEACHGPGSEYLRSHWEGQEGYESREADGFVVYRDIDVRDGVCRSCHNALSPTYKPFNVAAFSDAIRHWSNEHRFEEVAVETEVAVAPPRPASEAPPPMAAVVASPPPVVTMFDRPAPSAGGRTPSALPPEEARPERPAQAEEPPPPAEAREPAPAIESSDATGRDEGPVEAVLGGDEGRRGPVPFPHQDHFDFVSAPATGGESCQNCHHTSEVGETPESCSACHLFEGTEDAPSSESAYHGTCKNCHREERAGPTKCSECHL